MILYFSGTGNSKYVAERISEETGDCLFCINEKIKNGETTQIDEKERLVFVTPTYAWRIPHVVEKWILNTVFPKGLPCYFIMSCGDSIGNAMKFNKAICAKKDFCYMGTARVIMPENYIALFNTPGRDEAVKIVSEAESFIDGAINKIKNNELLNDLKPNLLDNFLSGAVNAAFYPMFVKDKGFTVKDSCVGCGKCKEICPVNNISLLEKKPKWQGGCTHCMGCISYCPKGAIEYKNSTQNKVKYTFEGLGYHSKIKQK